MDRNERHARNSRCWPRRRIRPSAQAKQKQNATDERLIYLVPDARPSPRCCGRKPSAHQYLPPNYMTGHRRPSWPNCRKPKRRPFWVRTTARRTRARQSRTSPSRSFGAFGRLCAERPPGASGDTGRAPCRPPHSPRPVCRVRRGKKDRPARGKDAIWHSLLLKAHRRTTMVSCDASTRTQDGMGGVRPNGL